MSGCCWCRETELVLYGLPYTEKGTRAVRGYWPAVTQVLKTSVRKKKSGERLAAFVGGNMRESQRTYEYSKVNHDGW